MTQSQQPVVSNAARLGVLRIIWAALLLGQLIFMVAIALVIWPGQTPESRPGPEQMKILQTVAWAMLFVMLPASYVARRIIYGKPDDRGRVPPEKYVIGKIVEWAMLEGVSFLALVGMMLEGKALPFLWVALIAMINQVINFPTGTAMEGTGPRMMHRRD